MKALPEFRSGPLQTALLPASNGDQRADVTIRLQTHRDGSCPRAVLLPQTGKLLGVSTVTPGDYS